VVQDSGSVACRGNETSTGKLYPPSNVAFHAVTAGDDFSCGLTTNGSLRCWGGLPGGSTQLPPASTFFIDAHAGPRHVCGLVPNGTVYCYGDASSRGAVNVPPGVVFQGVTAGANYTCGVARNHSVVCWGDSTNPVVAAVATWQSITDAEHVAAGADHACYIRVNGSVACWGSNARGGAAPPPALVTNGSVWWLAAGAGMMCAMSGSSVPSPVTCWGAVSGTIATTGYEVACAGWGCVASTANSSARVTVAAAIGGGTIPQNVGISSAVVTTLAGNGISGSTDGVGTVARFYQPLGVSLDGVGGLYVADYANHIIRRVGIATRNVTTVAGVVNTPGSTVGPTPLQSTFWYLYGVEADGVGNVADTWNHAIRMLSGVWVAGNKTSGFANAVNGTNAMFSYPEAIAADSAAGLLFVADVFNNQVRTITTAGTHTVSSLAVFTGAVFAVALDTLARVAYVAAENAVYVVTYTGVSTLLAGKADTNGSADGIGSAARFNSPRGLASDTGRRLVFATEKFGHRIRCITATGGVVTTLAGSGEPGFVDDIGTSAAFYHPYGIAVDAASGTLYIGGYYNHAIRQVQLPLPAPVILAAAPLAPLPLAPTHQLTSWRALGTASNGGLGAATTQSVLDARNATFSSPLTAANTAGQIPAIGTLLLSNVTLAPRSTAPAAAGNINTTFSTSAQRGLRLLALQTAAVPAASLALPALANLTLAAPAPTQQVQLAVGSFDGLATLTCINCGSVDGLANFAGLRFGDLLAQPPALPLITALDASATGIITVNEHDFDGVPALRWLSLANNNKLAYVSDAAFSATKQPELAVVDQSYSRLVTGGGCPSAAYLRGSNLAFNGAPYSTCGACPAGAACPGGAGLPIPCGANTYAVGGAAVCTPCPPGT